MKHPITLAQARLEGRDPLSLFRADRALLLDPAWLARIESGAPLMFWGQDDEEDDDDHEEPCGYDLVGNVAVVDVEGPIAQRGWFCVDGYDSITASVEAALADTRAESVLLRLNSPGGAAAGAFEWTRRMRDAVVASKKRCVAYADEMAFSGAYAVACVADEIVVPETGCVGSVGVIASMVSRAKKNTMDGFDVRVIQNGAEKADGHPDLPIDPEAVAREQRSVDQLAEIFHRWVGERRGMTSAAVAALEAGTRMGGEAVAARLADRVIGWHALLAEMQRRAPTTAQSNAAPMARTNTVTATRKTMNEELIAAVTAATGEANIERAVGLLVERNAASAKTIDALTTDLGAANARAQAAEARIAAAERDAVLTSAKASGQWAPSLDAFLATLSVEQLRAWQSTAPRVVPAGEIQAPGGPAQAAGAMPADIAAAVAKARDTGWKSLTAREKHAITTHNATLAASLRAG